MSTIYHLTTQAEWEASRGTPEHRAASLAEEGFIHCSQDKDQMLRVANRLFIGQPNVIALQVDTDLLTSLLKREPDRRPDETTGFRGRGERGFEDRPEVVGDVRGVAENDV